MKIKNTILICLLALTGLEAGPVVIRDGRLKGMGVVPALGRGYSPGTNRYQALCLGRVGKTKSSYNFYYLYQQLEQNGSLKSNVRAGNAGRIGARAPGLALRKSAKSNVVLLGGKRFYRHHILVTLIVDEYITALNESESSLNAAAVELLRKKDLPGFFDGCGPYYVRSISRYSRFDSLFSYMSERKNRDQEFEVQLEANIRGWGRGAGTKAGVKSSLAREAERRRLSVLSMAWGLSKGRPAGLISYDLASFRTAIRDAMLSMQERDVGEVSSIEVAPWTEFGEFQKYVKLEQRVEGGRKYGTYEQKRIMNQNAEFLARLESIARKKLNLYHKARICRRKLDNDFKQGAIFKQEFKNSKFAARNGGEELPVSKLDAAVSNEKLKSFRKGYDDFFYGKAGAPGVVTCVAELGRPEIMHLKRFGELPACSGLEQRLIQPEYQVIEAYCMPKIAQ